MSQEKKFYVYVHRYASGPKQGEVFYVGKGSGGRCNLTKHSRSIWWTNVFHKYGRTVEIIKSGMSEDCAMTYEKILINALRKSGKKIVNIADGGRGSTGFKPNWSRKVSCSNGLTFNSIKDAAKWATGFSKRASRTTIRDVCEGKRNTAYGHTWAYGVSIPKPVTCGKNAGVPVKCSNGIEFEKISDAVRYLKSIGFKSASSTKISQVAKGKRKTAYGFTWKYLDEL